jgi:hypothetical protein
MPKPKVLPGFETEYERDTWASAYLSLAAIDGDCTSKTQLITRINSLFMG